MQTNNTSNHVKPDEFRVGDVVWCLIHGKGKVYEVNTSNESVSVYFDSGRSDGYTSDGYFLKGCNRALFFSEPKVEASVTRPFVPTLVGKTVMLQYYDETWTVKPVTIMEETSERVFTKDGSDFKSDLLAIYEVSSENILKP